MQFDSTLARHHDFLPVTDWEVGGDAEDFQVEESLPEPEGRGEHLYLYVKKKGLTSFALKRRLRDHFALKDKDIGLAGLKDRNAITSQWVSLHLPRLKELPPLPEWEEISFLKASFGERKLRMGEHSGNRFRIVLRGEGARENIYRNIERVKEFGFPNYFGLQRFGNKGQNVEYGRRIVLGESRDLPRHSHHLRKLWISAFQSWLFNAYLHKRRTEQTLRGDHLESGRPTGPLFGGGVYPVEFDAEKLENQVLESHRVSRKDVSFLKGDRRFLFHKPLDLKIIAEKSDSITAEVTLPKGAYASVLFGMVTGVFERGVSPRTHSSNVFAPSRTSTSIRRSPIKTP